MRFPLRLGLVPVAALVAVTTPAFARPTEKPVYCVAFAPDSKTLLSGNSDAQLLLWSVGDAKLLARTRLSAPATALRYFPNGNHVLVGLADGTLHDFDASTLRELARWEKTSGAINALQFSPDGKTIAIGSANGTLSLRDTTGKTCWTQQGDSGKGGVSYIASTRRAGGGITCLAFSPDGKTLASGGGDQTVKLWNTQTGKRENKLQGHLSCVWSVAWTPDGQSVYSASQDGTLRFWNPRTGKETRRIQSNPIERFVTVPGAPATIAVISGNISLYYWNRNKIQHAFNHPDPYGDGNANRLTQRMARFFDAATVSNDGNYVAGGHEDGTILLWNTGTGQLHTQLQTDKTR